MAGAFYTYIVEELPVLMRQFFPLSEKREDNFIAGNSMGGYGAMKIGINNPDRYAAIGCFSAGANGGKPMPNNSGMFDDQKWNMMNFTNMAEKTGEEQKKIPSIWQKNRKTVRYFLRFSIPVAQKTS